MTQGNCFTVPSLSASVNCEMLASTPSMCPTTVKTQWGRLQRLNGTDLYWHLMTDSDLDKAIDQNPHRAVGQLGWCLPDLRVTRGQLLSRHHRDNCGPLLPAVPLRPPLRQGDCSNCNLYTTVLAQDMLICFHRLCVKCKQSHGRGEADSVEDLQCPVCQHSTAEGADAAKQCPICTCREDLLKLPCCK
ncbi:unnamed protein product [Vitrella brassicaformis CCMP3155]|uniref:RING-type domain-containing protein n=1 Tax=Vitrella brassicaformis (strain CCMP3155) TaxID=1169540 RepID=A0A0G4FQ28_VITBC|nr:unnamed protein product [Vitrella brassicaformis CCMP3155]|eukprot:CEM15939.1 unnamed protein product [Vitrella brassicaformis CCMP3155]